MTPEQVAKRFGADDAEPVTLGQSGAVVLRLSRGGETLFWKSGDEAADEVERLAWLASTDIPAPRVLDHDDDWVLTSQLAGRDVAQPWPAHLRAAVLDAMLDGLRTLHALDPAGCPFGSRFPAGPGPVVVTHGDFCSPNVFVDPDTLRFCGLVDVGWLGVADPYADLSAVMVTLGGTLNPQYGGMPTARRYIEAYGGDPDDPGIDSYYALR